MPGFKQYFAANPPAQQLPNQVEQQLLQDYRPRIYLAEGQNRFIDFYADYIAQGALYTQGELISTTVDQRLLNQYRDDPEAEFRHIPTQQSGTPVVYGRVNYDTLTHEQQSYPLTFLNYNLVFAHSGILKGLAGWQNQLLEITGFHTDWHQLDHYVGLSIVLHNNAPLAAILQQHNYQTTYLLNRQGEHSLPLPADKRLAVDVALQSNELYPHQPEMTQHPSASFITADNIEFIGTGENKPLMAGFDVTQGEQEQHYTLKFLPPSDAFYTFKGRLGEKRSLPGRDGPPGANYVTLPGLMPWANRLVTGFRTNNITHEQAKISGLFNEADFAIIPEGLQAYRKDFVEAAFP